MSLYSDHWDRYVKVEFPAKHKDKEGIQWPGDEWANEPFWERVFETLFVPAEVKLWKVAAEIGAGAGKYTQLVFDAAPDVQVLLYDVSAEFLKVCKKRFKARIKAGQAHLQQLFGKDPAEMLLDIESRGLGRQLDAVYSIDAVVHVDFQYVAAYLTTAALTLRQGGYVILTLADASSEHGFLHLMRGISLYYDKQGQPCGKFEYIGPEMVRRFLTRLGFELRYFENWTISGQNVGRDLFVIATLEDLEKADEHRSYLLPQQ